MVQWLRRERDLSFIPRSTESKRASRHTISSVHRKKDESKAGFIWHVSMKCAVSCLRVCLLEFLRKENQEGVFYSLHWARKGFHVELYELSQTISLTDFLHFQSALKYWVLEFTPDTSDELLCNFLFFFYVSSEVCF